MTDRLVVDRPLALDAVVVMLSPTKGTLWSHANLVVAAALLVELTRLGRLTVTGSQQQLEVAVHDPTPVGDDLLDEALRTVGAADGPIRVTKVITMLPTSDQVLDRLVAEGAVTEESDRKFGLFKVQRHRPTPAAGRDALRSTVRAAFKGETEPDSRSVMLFSVVDIGPNLRGGLPSERRPEVARQAYAIRDTIGEGESALVSTIDEVVRRANAAARDSIG